jgi:hypothetical protein
MRTFLEAHPDPRACFGAGHKAAQQNHGTSPSACIDRILGESGSHMEVGKAEERHCPVHEPAVEQPDDYHSANEFSEEEAPVLRVTKPATDEASNGPGRAYAHLC